MPAVKKLPYDKTVVTEVKVTLADLLSKTVTLRSSVAAPIALNAQFNRGDATISHSNPLNFDQVTSCLILSSFEDFDVIFPGAQDVVLRCKGLFIHNGAAGRVVVKPPIGTDLARLQYVWA